MEIKYNGMCPMCGVVKVESSDCNKLCDDCEKENTMLNIQLKKLITEGHTHHCAWSMLMSGESDLNCPYCNPKTYYS